MVRFQVRVLSKIPTATRGKVWMSQNNWCSKGYLTISKSLTFCHKEWFSSFTGRNQILPSFDSDLQNRRICFIFRSQKENTYFQLRPKKRVPFLLIERRPSYKKNTKYIICLKDIQKNRKIVFFFIFLHSRRHFSIFHKIPLATPIIQKQYHFVIILSKFIKSSFCVLFTKIDLIFFSFSYRKFHSFIRVQFFSISIH